MYLIIRFIKVFLGGFFFWIIKGFKTSLKYELGDSYLFRNYIASTLIILAILAIISWNRIEKVYWRKETKIQILYDQNGKVNRVINQYGDTVIAEEFKIDSDAKPKFKFFREPNKDTMNSKKETKENYKNK